MNFGDKTMKRIRFAAIAGALGLLLVAGGAQAQLYHYKDANGRTVYSDTPPPPGTPAGNVMKAPKLTEPAAPVPATASADAKDPDGKDKKTGPMSTAEREADYKKRQAEAAKKAKEEGEKTAAEQNRQARCAGLQTNLAALQSGQRMKKFDANGNPYFAEDPERAADISKAQADMASAKCS
jgi:Domain of unknown function (DUF4124)